MQTPNPYGVYAAETTEQVAISNRAVAKVSICQCDDDLYRHAVSFDSPTSGFGGPITRHTTGHTTIADARLAGISELVRRLECHTPDGTQPDREHVITQLREALRQPSLFDHIT